MIIALIPALLLVLMNIKLVSETEEDTSGDLSSIAGFFLLFLALSVFASKIRMTDPWDRPFTVLNGWMRRLPSAVIVFCYGLRMGESVKHSEGKFSSGVVIPSLIKNIIRSCIVVAAYTVIIIIGGKKPAVKTVFYSFLGWKNIGNTGWYILLSWIALLCVYAGYGIFSRRRKGASVLTFILGAASVYVVSRYKSPDSYNVMICFFAGQLISAFEETLTGAMADRKKYAITVCLLAFSSLILYKTMQMNAVMYGMAAVSFCCLLWIISLKLTVRSRLLNILGTHSAGIAMMLKVPFSLAGSKITADRYIYLLVFIIAGTALGLFAERVSGFLGRAAGEIGSIRSGSYISMKNYQFLFSELVKRDFKKKYKRTALGMVWSVLYPVLLMFVMKTVFTQFFGRNSPHYSIYLFCGNLIFSYFSESTSQGMTALVSNASIFSRAKVPKFMFVLSKNVQTLINFGCTMIVFFMFCLFDGITFTWKMLALVYPVIMLLIFNIGVGLILSAAFVFFKDAQYLWSIFTRLLMYMSAIFYQIEKYPENIQYLFFLNPVYLFIRYFRKVVIEATVPSLPFHVLMAAYAFLALGTGISIYHRKNDEFMYYL